MYMRYLGGGVGHREEYLTVDHAREQRHRARRARLRWEHTNGARIVGHKIQHEEDDEEEEEQSDAEDSPMRAGSNTSGDDEDDVDACPAVERTPGQQAREDEELQRPSARASLHGAQPESEADIGEDELNGEDASAELDEDEGSEDEDERTDLTLGEDDERIFGDDDVYMDQDADEFADAGFARP